MEEEEKISGEETAAEQAGEGSADRFVPSPDEEAGETAILTSVSVDAELGRRLNAPYRTLLFVLMGVGIFLLAAYIVLSVLSWEGITEISESSLELLLWAGAFLFGFGLVFLISMGRLNGKQFEKGFVNHYMFYPSHVVIRDERGGEQISLTRLRYSDFEKCRETKHFFLLYPNRVTYYPVDKAKLSSDECGRLRLFLGLQPKRI